MSTRTLLGAVAACSLVGNLGAAGLMFSHGYGEIVDRGSVIAKLYSSTLVALECPSNVTYARSGKQITLTTRTAPPGQVDSGNCRFVSTIDLGTLPSGSYEVKGEIRSPDGLMLESATSALQVHPLGLRCNEDPRQNLVLGTPVDRTPAQFVARVQSDPIYAASLGIQDATVSAWDGEVLLEYPPLENMAAALDRLVTAGSLADVFRFDIRSFGGTLRYDPLTREYCEPTVNRDAIASFVEYFNASRDHYFYTGDLGEIAAIDAGKVGQGWTRTGKSFKAVVQPACPFGDGNSVVYRFNGKSGIGPDSHFFTRDRAECSVVDRSAKWSFEGLPFWASAPNADGTCDPMPSAGKARVPLYRAWRPVGDSNHRFSTDRAVIDEMVTKGWIDEGPAMCVLGSN